MRYTFTSPPPMRCRPGPSFMSISLRARVYASTVSDREPGWLLMRASSYDSADLLHASGFLAVDPFAYLDRDGERVILTSSLEAGRARKQSRATAVREVDEFGMQKLLKDGKSEDEANGDVLVGF